jgi:outer membrane protein assembly factor BamB
MSVGFLMGCLPTGEKLEGHRVLVGDYTPHIAAIVDRKGEIVWKHKIQQMHCMQYLPNGNILMQTTWTKIQEINPENNKIVWKYDAATMNGNKGKKVEVHGFQRLKKGITMIAESGPARIIEVDKNGKLLKTINMKIKKRHPHRDTRMCIKTPQGTYLAAHEADGYVREYNDKSEVVWEYKTGTAVYGVCRMKNGNTLIGTGNGHSVLEVDKKGKVVWSVKEKELPGIKLNWVTYVQELKNGNIIIGNCHAGKTNPQIIEVTKKDKKVVWTFNDQKTFGNNMAVQIVIDNPVKLLE